MEWAELILEYVKALTWPAVVGGAVFTFRRQIAVKIKDLKDATTPVGGASFFDREAKAVEAKAEAAAERHDAEQSAPHPDSDGQTPSPETPPESGPVADEDSRSREAVQRAIQRRLDKRETFAALTTAWGQLNALPEFDVARGIAKDSPRAAVMLAYADLEKVARAAFTIARMKPPARATMFQIIRDLSHSGSLDRAFAAIAINLTDLRANVAHGDDEGLLVSLAGALDFIGACERLTDVLAQNALSRLRHPSRSQIVREWLEWAESEGLIGISGDDDSDDDEDGNDNARET